MYFIIRHLIILKEITPLHLHILNPLHMYTNFNCIRLLRDQLLYPTTNHKRVKQYHVFLIILTSVADVLNHFVGLYSFRVALLCALI